MFQTTNQLNSIELWEWGLPFFRQTQWRAMFMASVPSRQTLLRQDDRKAIRFYPTGDAMEILTWSEKTIKNREITIGNNPLVSFDQRFEALGAGLVFTCVYRCSEAHMRKCRNFQALTIKKRFGFTHLIWSKTVGVCVSELIKSVGVEFVTP